MATPAAESLVVEQRIAVIRRNLVARRKLDARLLRGEFSARPAP